MHGLRSLPPVSRSLPPFQRSPSLVLRSLSPALSAVLLMGMATSPPALAQDVGAETSADGPRVELDVAGSPLIRDGERGEVTVSVGVDVAVDDLEVRVVSFGGSTVKTLAEGPRRAGTLRRTWKGRDDAGREVADGPYRIIATASDGGGTSREEAWVTLAQRPVYPRHPDWITVVVDPGHGGSFDGALGKDGTREADLNLDIAMRLARMLEGAGVNVVMTRTSDTEANEPAIDLSGDGVIDITDDLAARTDIANLARADVFVAVHNNIAVNKSVGGPSTFYYDQRPFGDRSLRLARIIQGAMVDELSSFSGDGWTPFDHGALIYPYYVLRGFDRERRQRPTQMPGVLSEGLFLSNPRELELLKRSAVRAAMARAYYDAIAGYLARRGTHVGYELLDGPSEAQAGEVVEFEVEVRDQGNERMRGWRLFTGALPAPPLYEGRGRSGDRVADTRIPRLGPGRRTVRTVRVTVPDEPGDWLLLFDARDRDGKRASRLGSPPLQVPLRVLPAPEAAPAADDSEASGPLEGS